MAPIDKGEYARQEICHSLEDMGFLIEASHHELAQGQHEIDFKYADALTTADNVVTFKIAVRAIAQKHGLHATFMPKPVYGIAGSGMHINISLSHNGNNAFYNPEDKLGLSEIAYSSIGGIINNIKPMAAVLNQSVNSYKRLVPGYEAPCYIAWSGHNRSPLIRIPAARGAGTRIELRNPDPSCNPYLAFALVLSACLDGIEKGVKPPKSVDRNIYKMTKEDMKEEHIERLPENLLEAVKYFKNSEFITEVLGEHIQRTYYKHKMREWTDYSAVVHKWEIEQYLTKY